MLHLRPIACFVFGCALFAAGRASAEEPFLKVTACEPVQVAGQNAYRLTLSIAGTYQFYDEVAIHPPYGLANPDTCTILEASPPPGWAAYRFDDGVVLFLGSPVDQGQYLDGFQITLNRASCCKLIILSNFLLFDSPGGGNVCFHDCLATPSHATSWGSVKVLYR
jgi:hypothetical protein